jgi:hypothetical protein
MSKDLRQADFSNLSVTQMTVEQRAELRRRLDAFMDAYGVKPRRTEPEPDKNVRKWVPGMKA